VAEEQGHDLDRGQLERHEAQSERGEVDHRGDERAVAAHVAAAEPEWCAEQRERESEGHGET
jgi:hypothetical protein